MAKITFSIAEVVRILNSGGLVSEPLTEIKTKGDKFLVKLKTGWPRNISARQSSMSIFMRATWHLK